MEAKDRFKKLLKKYENDPEYIAEGVIIDVMEQLVSQLEQRKLSRSKLAEKLGCSNAYVTKLLNGSENLTIKKLVEVAHALGCTVDISFVPWYLQLTRFFTFAPRKIERANFNEDVNLKNASETLLPTAA